MSDNRGERDMIGPALIPAAGLSMRMGRPKLLLPLGGITILERLITAARAGGVSGVLVIVRPSDRELADTAHRAGADVLVLAADTPDMRATVLAGLDWLEQRLPAHQRAGFFLIPADHPSLNPDVFRVLLEAAHAEPRASVILPTHAGRRGHPVWIGWDHVPGLRQVPEGQGINKYLREQRAVTREIPWPNDDVLTDLDTPDDYLHLLRRSEADAKSHVGLGDLTLIGKAGAWHSTPTTFPAAILPGAFNPVHDGHWGLARTARELLGTEVAFELSSRNVDKPDLADDEIRRRAAQFLGQADLWVTRAPLFLDKANLFPGVVFVVGADTAQRLLATRYYESDESRRDAALDRLLETGTRFLVAARREPTGAVLSLDSLVVPTRWRDLFVPIPETLFRLDISSTELRRQAP